MRFPNPYIPLPWRWLQRLDHWRWQRGIFTGRWTQAPVDDQRRRAHEECLELRKHFE